MFAPLAQTELGERYRLVPVDLPGCGNAPPLRPTTLAALAEFVHDAADCHGARIVVAHSMASIIASLTATRIAPIVTGIVSLEGNLTAVDAYFSGTAADFAGAPEFRDAFLRRLGALAANDRLIGRYRSIVARADPQALWELGRDIHDVSLRCAPGETLARVPEVCYLYNPVNLPEATLAWLAGSSLPRAELVGASHWASVAQPHLLAHMILQAIRGWRSARGAGSA